MSSFITEGTIGAICRVPVAAAVETLMHLGIFFSLSFPQTDSRGRSGWASARWVLGFGRPSQLPSGKLVTVMLTGQDALSPGPLQPQERDSAIKVRGWPACGPVRVNVAPRL